MTKDAVVIDPVLDFEPGVFTISSQSADALLKLVHREGYELTRRTILHLRIDRNRNAHVRPYFRRRYIHDRRQCFYWR